MPTAKEYRRLAREDDKHRALFRGMAKWKAEQEREAPSPQDIADVQAMVAADIGVPVRMLDPIPDTPEANDYVQHLLPGRREPSAFSALQVIADLPTGRNLDVMEGQEQAFRAVESLFAVPPRIVCR